MGAVVSESLGRVSASLSSLAAPEAIAKPLDAQDLRVLARTILETEPSDIRGLVRQDPGLVHDWVSQLKTQQFQSSGTVDVLHDALDHIRLSTLSPLKFAAE
jgi:hypothetical protein